MKTVEKIERKLPVLKARKRVAAYARVSMESERMLAFLRITGSPAPAPKSVMSSTTCWLSVKPETST